MGKKRPSIAGEQASKPKKRVDNKTDGTGKVVFSSVV